MKELMTKLTKMQQELNVPKNRDNAFGGFKYRSCEDILVAAKKLTKENGLLLTLSDEIVNLGDRFYVKATATISDGADCWKVYAYAKEAESQKGMNAAQLTGSTSSYARKYALNGLFCIDDSQDGDVINIGEDNEVLTDKQLSDIMTLVQTCKDLKIFDEPKFLKFLKAENYKEITKASYDKAIKALKTKLGE